MRPRRAARAPARAPDSPAELTRRALEAARRLGCVAAGVVPAGPAPGWDRYRAWLDEGLHGEMDWLERDADARRDPEAVMSGTRSILVVAVPVGDPSPGNVARYARGEDYHERVKRLLGEVREELRPHAPPRARFRICVDTAPLLERELALRAGLGFVGKNGLLIVPDVGSHVVLGEMLTDFELAEASAEVRVTSASACAGCTRCLDACPTSAFVAPGVLDASRCLSYLTIEKRGPFTAAEERAVAESGMLFGCDVCQDVCPWNAPFFADADVRPRAEADLAPEPLLGMDHESYEARFGGSALWRATREGLARNAKAVLARRHADE